MHLSWIKVIYENKIEAKKKTGLLHLNKIIKNMFCIFCKLRLTLVLFKGLKDDLKLYIDFPSSKYSLYLVKLRVGNIQPANI